MKHKDGHWVPILSRAKKVLNKDKTVSLIGTHVDMTELYATQEKLEKQHAFLKIDGSLIKNINNDSNMKSIVSTILDFTQKMGYKTIAEFVESEEIVQTVQELGIDYLQGYYIGAPSEDLQRT